jgi:hypothetical protein
MASACAKVMSLTIVRTAAWMRSTPTEPIAGITIAPAIPRRTTTMRSSTRVKARRGCTPSVSVGRLAKRLLPRW